MSALLPAGDPVGRAYADLGNLDKATEDLVIAAQWAETVAAATHAAALLPADVTVATQGHVLFAADFLVTLGGPSQPMRWR